MSQISMYWKQFTDTLQEVSAIPDISGSFHFGGKEDASSIAQLVISGTKIATGSLMWGYEYEQTAIPAVGEYNIITDSDDHPVCIIQTEGVSVVPFDEVGDKFAFDCGEGDRTLESWREMYWEYIGSECRRMERMPTKKIPMVCEYFKVVYKEPLQA